MKSLYSIICLFLILELFYSCRPNSSDGDTFKVPAGEEVVEEKVTEEVVEEKVIEEVAEEKVTEEVAEEIVTEEVAEEKVIEEVAEEIVTEEVAEEKVIEEVAEEKGTEENQVFSYNKESGSCTSLNDLSGSNLNYLGDCGLLQGGTVEGMDTYNNSYFGIQLDNVYIFNSNIEIEHLIKFEALISEGTRIEGIDNLRGRLAEEILIKVKEVELEFNALNERYLEQERRVKLFGFFLDKRIYSEKFNKSIYSLKKKLADEKLKLELLESELAEVKLNKSKLERLKMFYML